MTLELGRFRWKTPERQLCMNLCVVGLILLPIYIKFMGVLSQVLSFSTTLTTYLYYGALWLLLLIGIKGIVRQAVNAVIVTVAFTLIIAFEILIHPTSVAYIFGGDLVGFVAFQPTAMLQAILFIFIGLAVSDFERLGVLLHKGARIGVVGAALTYAIMLIQGISIHYDDMSTAYGICLLMCILVAYQERKDWLFIGVGIVCLVLAGTRGPIICLITAMLFKFIIFEKNFRRKFWGIVLCVVAGVVIYGGIGTQLLVILGKLFSHFGITKLRFLDYINNGILLDGSGREDFTNILFAAIQEHPILGYGIGGDRLILGRSYAHNLILEALVALGIIGGGVFLVWVAYLSFGVLTSPKPYIRQMGIGLFCGIVVKLFMSSSFIVSKEFFLFLGLCIAAKSLRKRRAKTESEEYK